MAPAFLKASALDRADPSPCNPSFAPAWPNFIPEQDADRLRHAYGPAVWQRLQAIRSWWDPDDVFAGGHAITLPD